MQAGLGGGQQHLDQIGFQAHQNGLRLGVTQTAVEFQCLGPAAGINHQASVQEAGERNAVLFHPPDGRQDDFSHGSGMHIRCHYRRR